MTHKHKGGPAFPFGQTDSMSGQLVNGWGSKGMSLRDYFAAKAMQGMYAADTNESIMPISTKVAEAYAAADAMLKAREQPPPCRECGGDGSGGEHEEDCAMVQEKTNDNIY